jgi:rfaE bifunctional protein nucleotidyltransferase chain/domain
MGRVRSRGCGVPQRGRLAAMRVAIPPGPRRLGAATRARYAVAVAAPIHWTHESLAPALAAARRTARRVVFTNGCFDLLHAGHVRYLGAARTLGDVLVVGLNDDGSVRRLKGPSRPIVPAAERAEALAGLAAVDHVVLFGDDTPLALVEAVRPEVLVKGADWAEDAIVGADAVRSWGGRVERIDLVPGISTSEIIRRIREG